MLVLTRKIGEAVIIKTPHGNMRVSPHWISGDRVKLSFDGPSEIGVVREELLATEPPESVESSQ